MGKENNPRRVAENEAFAKTKMLRTSPQKLNLVAQLIRGKKVDKALADLTFSHKRIAGDVKNACNRQSRTPRTTMGWTWTTWLSPKPGSARTW
jgi:ribosomal protein L22